MIGRGAALGLLALFVAGAAPARAETAHPERLRGVDRGELSYTYEPGAFAPEYDPPPPGSYALPVIDTPTDHPLLDTDGRPTTLFTIKGNRIAIVAFVYTTCVETAGCPLSLAVLHRLDAALADDPALARAVTLVTVSFDPEQDTPARMRIMRRFHRPRTDWHFLTARDTTQLAPLLADFDQPVAKLRYPDGAWTGLFRHVLKVYLLDGANRVRNVYSTGFLNPALLLNDARTLLLEAATTRR
jgi:cytochrome c peroxidase